MRNADLFPVSAVSIALGADKRHQENICSGDRSLPPVPKPNVYALRDGQQVITINTLVFSYLIVCAYPARVDHDAALGIGLGV